MIPTRILEARAARGYVWLEKRGAHFGLDVAQLHERVADIDVSDPFWCPLSISDTGKFDTRPLFTSSPYLAVVWRLEMGHTVNGKTIRVLHLDTFLNRHGFNMWPNRVAYHLLRAGSRRDWQQLSLAWRKVIRANPLSTMMAAVDKVTPETLRQPTWIR